MLLGEAPHVGKPSVEVLGSESRLVLVFALFGAERKLARLRPSQRAAGASSRSHIKGMMKEIQQRKNGAFIAGCSAVPH